MVGDGPALARVEAKHPEVHFAGARLGIELARHYACGDVFVFPSRTDTFGLVLLEALASGVPVAAYPVPGPLDVIGNSGCGVLDHDLGRAMALALAIPRARCLAHAAPLLLAPLRRAVSRPPAPDRDRERRSRRALRPRARRARLWSDRSGFLPQPVNWFTASVSKVC